MDWYDDFHHIIINDVEVFPEYLNTNFLYMITFFKIYKEFFGVNGTIGAKTNKNTLQNIYKDNIFLIPLT